MYMYLHATPRNCTRSRSNVQALAPYAAYKYRLMYVSICNTHTVMESPNAPTTFISYGVNS